MPTDEEYLFRGRPPKKSEMEGLSDMTWVAKHHLGIFALMPSLQHDLNVPNKNSIINLAG